MYKNFTPLIIVCSVIFSFSAKAQWTKTSADGEFISKSNNSVYYKLDIDNIRLKLISAKKISEKSNAVIIEIPTEAGTMEKFAVHSFPVLDEALEAKYHLGSYVGTGIDDPSKFIRFSVAPNDFQSMVISKGKYEFIESASKDKKIYYLHSKSNKDAKSFICGTKESPASIERLQQLMSKTENTSRSGNKKFFTIKLAIAVTGEYTAYFGGTAGALSAINATMSRVDGVFEQELNCHLNVINAPQLIFTDATTDPFSDATKLYNWNYELLTTLHDGYYGVTDADFDIGHLFGASGGGGNAGCVGCIGSNDTSYNTYSSNGTSYKYPNNYKGSAYTSPADNIPAGDTFDIDYVAHEMGHQLGDNHTFSKREGSGYEVEPGSGSTIMAYAGITGATTDVQKHSDPYFHSVSIDQVQATLLSAAVGVQTAITNNPPVVTAFPRTYTVPLETAFVLTATATDPENNPLTYCWEEVDPSATSSYSTMTNIGTSTTKGASFRSFSPVASPTRYFPKLSTVLSGAVRNDSDFEATSSVARTSNFRVTVRDNVAGGQAQTAYQEQTVVIGSAAAFTVNSGSGVAGSAVTIKWIVSGTTASPYNVADVKIDYTNDNGATWNVLTASTPNNGTASVIFPSSLGASSPYVRVSAIGNVFYAVNVVTLKAASLQTNETVNDKFQIYPNPTRDNLFVKNVSAKSIYSIFDATGRLALKGNLNNNGINVSGLPKGVYIISLVYKGKTVISKFIKE